MVFTLGELRKWHEEGTLLEAFGVGTAVIVAAIGRIGYRGEEDIVLANDRKGLGAVGQSLWNRITEIQTGKVEWQDWSYVCE
jgi:branched-chain amino acid aminotransferase